MTKFVVALVSSFIVLTMAVIAKPSNTNIIVDGHGRLQKFYGIPLTITIHELEESGLKFTPGWASDEGAYYPTAKIVANKGVKFDATFSQEGDLYMLETSSVGVVGPHGVAIGSTLSQLEKAIPNGHLFWHATHGRHAATFDAGEGIYYEFSPADIPASLWVYNPNKDLVDRSIKIRSIRIAARRYQTSE